MTPEKLRERLVEIRDRLAGARAEHLDEIVRTEGFRGYFTGLDSDHFSGLATRIAELIHDLDAEELKRRSDDLACQHCAVLIADGDWVWLASRLYPDEVLCEACGDERQRPGAGA